MKKRKSGFTLIELLVVISIVGILSSFILASLNTSRIKSQDAYRKSSMVQLQKALALYYDKYGAYPNTGQCWMGLSDNGALCGGARTRSGATGYIPNLAPEFLAILPDDPSPDRSGWRGFLYLSNGHEYVLLIHNTPASYPAAGQPFYDAQRPTWAWKVCVNDEIQANSQGVCAF